MRSAGATATSFVSGTSDRPLLYRTVDGVLKAAAADGPDRPAVIAPYQSLRYSGKVQKYLIWEHMRAELNLSEEESNRILGVSTAQRRQVDRQD